MEKTKEKRHIFLRHPLLVAIALPLVTVLIASFLSSLLTGWLIMGTPEWMTIGSEINAILLAVFRIVIALLIILIMKLSSGHTFQFGFRRQNLKLSFGLAAFGFLMVADNLIEGAVFSGVFQSTPLGIFSAVLAGIAPGLFEEVVCRGVVLSSMMRQWHGKENYILKSVLASGIIFGLIHLMNLGSADVPSTIMQVFYAAGMGIFFGAVYARTRNLWGTVVIHAIIDISYNLVVWQENGFALQDLVSGIAIAVVYTAIGLYLIRPKKQGDISLLWRPDISAAEEPH